MSAVGAHSILLGLGPPEGDIVAFGVLSGPYLQFGEVARIYPEVW